LGDLSKVLVIGIDGGSLKLVERWKDQLPTVRGFLEGGVYGELESTIPPITSPAWNCMFTGKNPAKIGIYDFIHFLFGSGLTAEVVNSANQDASSVWDILGESNIRTGIVNVPTNFPPRKVNGYMVCGGVLVPVSRQETNTYPSSLRDELRNNVAKDWDEDAYCDITIPGKEDCYLERFHGALERQAKIVKHLVIEHPCDLFITVFFLADSVQHYFWHHMDRSHPKWSQRQSERYGNVIKEYYRRIDMVIGDLMGELPEDTTVILVSDHGFGPLYGCFCVNEWLIEKGLLRIKRAPSIERSIDRALSFVRRFMLTHLSTRLLRLARLTPSVILQKFAFRVQEKSYYEGLLRSIDWSRTKAVALGTMGIFINLKGRGLHGIVEPGDEYERLRDRIIGMLREIIDPETGRRVVGGVFKKEEVYSGKHIGEAPDIVYFLDDMKYVQKVGISSGRLWVDSPYSGTHRLQGMFLACGKYIKKTGERIGGVSIYDVAPTILHIFGLPIPNDMDGHALENIFDPTEIAGRPVIEEASVARENNSKRQERTSIQLKSARKQVERRLRSLGYV